jgi:chloride channel 7
MMELKHIPFLKTEPPSSMLSYTVHDVMSPDVICFHLSERVSNVIQTLNSCQHNGFPVVDEKNRFHGLILREQLIHILSMKAFGEIPNDAANRPIPYEKFFELLGTDCPPISSISVTPEEQNLWIDLQPCILINPQFPCSILLLSLSLKFEVFFLTIS